MREKLINEGKINGFNIEIYETKLKATDINTLNDKVSLFQITNVATYKIKAIKDNKCVSLITESLKNPKLIIEHLNSIFQVQDNINENTLCNGFYEKKETDEKLDYEHIKNDLLSLNDLKKDFKEITNIEAMYTHYFDLEDIYNTNCNLHDEAYYNAYGVSISVKLNDITRVMYLSYYTKNYDFSLFKSYILEKINNLIIKLNSTSIATNKYRVLLTNNVVLSILETFAESFHSKCLYLQESVFTNKLNKKIFSDKITIIEDSLSGLKPKGFDNEGTLKEYIEIVKNGIFMHEVNNLEYALKLKEKPTGNAGGFNNLYIKPGDKTSNDLIKLLDNGVIVDEAYGIHSGVDLKSGNISVQAEGYLVENGMIKNGLNMIILSTNIFEVFSNVIEVGSDLSNSSLSFKTPSLLLDNITITGKE